MPSLIFFGFLLQALVGFGESASQRNKLLWHDVDANCLLVTLNDSSTEPCSIPRYPNKGRYSHPVAMTYLEHLGVVVGCGGLNYGLSSTRDCYFFDGTSWEPFQPMSLDHDAYKDASYNAWIDGLGWWVGGLSVEWPYDEGFINEVLTPEGEWKNLSIPSPYGDRFPRFQCIVQMNATHSMMTGGLWDSLDVLADTWILNWETYEWTASTPMMGIRAYHGCTLTPEGEVMILGGLDDVTYIKSVHIFNPVSEQWRLDYTIVPPFPEIYTGAAVLLNWGDDIIWLEPSTNKIHKRQMDGSWNLLDVVMCVPEPGERCSFDYYYSNVIFVPDDFVKVCN